MPCFHKFFGHAAHMVGENGLLPNWEADTLIIGTFNPSNDWVPDNTANYFYGRPRNHFWKVLPRFACHGEIQRLDDINQREFLIENRIALTDLLISINDANIDVPQNVNWINRFLDDDILNFHNFTWNSSKIVEYINENSVKKVYFTRSGFYNDLFDAQIAEIEHGIGNVIYRLHTPTGQGLRRGRPRKNKLIHRWFQQGGSQFPFLCPEFSLHNFLWL